MTQNQQIQLKKTPNLIFITVLFSIIILITGSLYFAGEKKRAQTEKYNDLRAISELKEDQITDWFHERISELLYFSGNKQLSQLVGQLGFHNDTSTYNKLNRDIALFSSNHKYENIFIVTPDAGIIYSLDTTFRSLSTTTLASVRELFEGTNSYLTDFSIGSKSKKARLDFMARVFDNNNQVGCIIFRVDPQTYLFPLVQAWPTPSETSETFLVRSDGDSVLFLNELRHKKNTALKFRLPKTLVSSPAVQAVAGRTGLFEGKDYRNKKVISNIHPVSGTNWYMVAKIDKSEIFSELNKKSVLIITLVIMTIFLVISVTAWIYHSRLRVMYHELLNREAELNRSQSEYRTMLQSIGDGVITTDNKGMIQFVNPVAESLTGWKADAAINHTIKDVFKILIEDTKEDAGSPVEKVLTKGQAANITDSLLLVSSDRREIPVDCNSAPIKNEQGETVGVILVFRDRSQERANQQAISESEWRFRTIFENSPVGKSVTGLDGTLMTNRAFCDMLGYTEKELSLKNWKDITHPDDLAKSEQATRELLSRDKPDNLRFEKRYLHKNGDVVWTDVSIAMHRDDSGKPLFFITSLIDITESKRAVEALKKSEERYHSTLDHMMEGCQIIDFDWKYVYLNDAADIHNRRPKTELMGKKYMDMWPGIEKTEVFGVIKNCLEERVPHHMENEFVFPDGTVGWFDLSIQPVPEGVFILSFDITERKKAESYDRLTREVLDHLNNYEDSEAMVRAIIKSIKVSTDIEAIGIRLRQGEDYPYYQTSGFGDDFVELERYLCSYDKNGNLRRNKSGDPLLECMCGNILCGRVNTAKSFFTEGGSFRSNNTTLLLESTTNEDRLARTRNRCNSAGYESVALVPIKNGQEIIGLLQLNDHRKNRFSYETIPFFERLASNIGIAITRNMALDEIRNMNRELENRVNERTNQLKLSNKELEAFAYSVSHDLRAPLRGIHGFTQILVEDYAVNLDDEAKRICSVIQDNTRKMGQLIDDLLSFSRLNRSELRKSGIEMTPLVRSVYQELTNSEMRKTIDFTLNDLSDGFGDLRMLKQVWVNLISNAIKFSGKKKQPAIEIGSSKDHDSVTYWVKDNGSGFDMKYADKLFGVFQRLHSENEFSGTGVGLAIVQRIVQRHGGQVSAEAKKGEGAKFYFTLPVTDEKSLIDSKIS